MPLFSKALWQAGAVLLGTGAAVCQTNTNSSARFGAGWESYIGGVVFPIVLTTGEPYSAEQVIEHAQTLPDGTHIVQQTQTVMLYRDSEGRTRTEHIFRQSSGASLTAFVEIRDPITGSQWTLDPQSHLARLAISRSPISSNQAHVATGPAQQQAGATTRASTPASERPHAHMVRESLGTKTIEDVSA